MKCEICNDNKTVIVHGLLDKPVELPCNCTCDKFKTNKKSEKLIQKLTNNLVKEITERREDVLQAFVAKYGYHPDEIAICEQPSEGRWWVEKRSKWISTKDKLPNIGESVLIYVLSKKETHTAEFCTFKTCDDWNISAGQYIYVPLTFEKSEVTHWMPIPSPPEIE